MPGVVGGGYSNPLGRASLAGPVAPAGPDQAPALARASVVGVKRSSCAITAFTSSSCIVCHESQTDYSNAGLTKSLMLACSMGEQGPGLAVCPRLLVN